MAVSAPEIVSLIKTALPGAEVDIEDLAGSGDHYAVRVTHEGFEGKTRVQQHQMVYQALQGIVGDALHALSLQTAPPVRE